MIQNDNKPSAAREGSALRSQLAGSDAGLDAADRIDPALDLTAAFSELFSGRTASFGVSLGDRAQTQKEPLQHAEYVRHLGPDAASGAWSLGLCPIRADGTLLFSALDFDAKNMSVSEVQSVLRAAKAEGLPIAWSRSKSEGLHGWVFFSEPVSPSIARRVLAAWGNRLGWNERTSGASKGRGDRFFEVFPKQDRLGANDHGNWIRLPYPGGSSAVGRMGVTDQAEPIPIGSWLSIARAGRLTSAQLDAYAQQLSVDVASSSGKLPSIVRPQPRMPLQASRDSSFLIGDLSDALKRLAEERADLYDTWITVLMAIHHQFAGTVDEPEAIAIATEWSAQSGRYENGDVEMKWRSFKPKHDGDEITIRSLRAWAAEDSGDDPVSRAVAGINEHYGHVLKGGGAILFTPSNRGQPEFLDARRWKEHHSNRTVELEVNGKTKRVPTPDLWLTHKERRSYHTVVFDPKFPALADVPSSQGPPGSRDFNLWPGLALEPSEAGTCDLFLDHLRTIVCGGDADLFEWVIQWLAHIVQHPARLAGTCLALRGPQGSGKTLIGEVLGKIIGPRLYTKTSRPEELTGRFNGHNEGRLLIQVEEGFWAGDHKMEGTLRNMITSDTIRIERKFMEPLEISNLSRVLITSNQAWIIPAGVGERRFAVLDVSGARANDLDYFGKLRSEVFEEGGCARFLHYLLHEVVVDWKLISRPPQTSALLEQQLQSLDPADKWLLDILRSGSLPGDEEGRGITSKTTLQAYFASAMNAAGRSWDGTPERLGKLLNSRFGDAISTARPRAEDGSRAYEYRFGPLEDSRATFAKNFGYAPSWDGSTVWQRHVRQAESFL